ETAKKQPMTGDRSQLINFVQKFLGTVKFGNDHVGKIMGYGDYQIGNVTISRVYYVEGLGHNLFFVGQFCDSDMEVAFRQHTCFIRNLEGVDLLTACAMGKSTKKTHKPKFEDTNQEKLYLFHMDLCGPMRVESVNGKKYILVIVDDYSRFTWVKFLRSKDETPMFIIKVLKMIQNRVVERRNRILIESARTMLIYAQAPLFLWAEAVATVCFSQNRSIIRLHHGKTSYELMHASRPDLQFAICMCARYQARPTEKHVHAVKRIFRYLRGTVNRGLWYTKDSSVALTAFADADHAGCQDTRRSTSGSVQFLGVRLISWSSKRYHFIKEQVENGLIELYFVNTEYQLADLFTKALGRDRIEFLTNKLGMRSFTPETLKKLMNEEDD
nr:uncharacterized mitochondrial protein AtMg00810-like [Tanacetum cinerariifolium]